MAQSDLREQLQSTLGTAYTLEREIGGGGMSRVFVAEEHRLGRTVVVKVLAPELVAGVSFGRFEREIRLAGSLQQANIVPVLTAGEVDGLPYYTMPFVDGESLRARLAGGPLRIPEAVSILRDVARALAYAHRQGVVHRDIKPDNVLLSEGTAVVTDFGIAKAIAAARGNRPERDSAPAQSAAEGRDLPDPALTGLGMSLGTPAYMAPEQTAGDPETDHRADIYAFGALGYELLTGRPPFAGLPPQRMLAAQMTERPAPIEALRSNVPTALAALIMQCLEKKSEARPQSAAEVLAALDRDSTDDNAAAPVIGPVSRRTLLRALAIYAAAFLGVALLALLAMEAIGLPEWVLPGALIVMALGLPVILLTALVHRQALVARTGPTTTPGGTRITRGSLSVLAEKLRRHVTWRRVALGGAFAVGSFALLIVGYMTLRSLGVGPPGSLIAAGVLGEGEPVLVADFRSPASDTSLGPVVSEALRADLGQSANIRVVQTGAIGDVLQRMRRPAGTRLDLTLAREIATREGIKVIVDGDVISLGSGFVIATRLVEAPTGEVLASYRETADDADEIIRSINRLSKRLRTKIGESLRSVRATRPLEQVTTGSLEAFRKYVQGVRATEIDGEFAKSVALLEEAIGLDTGFAMAYRKLAVVLNNSGGQTARAHELLQKAFDHRERLSDAERYMTLGTYYADGPAPNAAQAVAAYEALLDLQPDNGAALNNAALLYGRARDFRRSEAYLQRALAADSTSAVYFENLAAAQFALGKPSDAAATAARCARQLPAHPVCPSLRANLASAQGRYDSATALLMELRGARGTDLPTREGTSFNLASLARLHGRIAEAERWMRDARDAQAERGVASAALDGALDQALSDAWYFEDKKRAVGVLEDALARHPLDSIPPVERPYWELAAIYAVAGRPDRARTMLAALERRHATAPLLDDDRFRGLVLGHIALAERRYDDAVRELRVADQGECHICGVADLARAHDLAGNADSAIALFTHYIETPYLNRQFIDALYLAGVHKRLGELYDARGDTSEAVEHYQKFVDLWRNADPELQPKVMAVRRRLARLDDVEGR